MIGLFKTLTQEEFLDKCQKVHGDKYDYSKTKYVKSKEKITITCKKHGDFLQTPNDHLDGKGCKKCADGCYDTEEFIRRANKVHNNKYDYTKTRYLGDKEKVIITCRKHGDFIQRPSHHLRGTGCKKCGRELSARKKTISQEEFVTRANSIHRNRYNYTLVEYIHILKKVKIICPIHGEFNQQASSHLDGSGCPNCRLSKGEMKVKDFLDSNNMKYVRNARFDECRNKNPLPFDFYLPEYNLCIEYDGQQHFMGWGWKGDEKSLRIIKIRDSIKTKYCKDNGIKLIRIKYTKYDKIEEILRKELNV